MKKLIICFLVLSSYGSLSGQIKDEFFWNTSFEHATPNQQPRKWSMEGEGEHFNARLINREAKAGAYCLEMKLKNAETYLILSIPGTLVDNRTLKASCYLKTAKGDSLQKALFFLDPSTGSPIMSKPELVSSSDWVETSFEHSFVRASESPNVLIALMTAGSGTIMVDDFEISVDGQSLGMGKVDFREPTEGEIAKIDKYAYRLRSIDITDSDTDLKDLNQMIGDARVVALGENSHGSAPIYRMKLRLVKYLVEELEFTVFALESPAVEADQINEFVVNGKGTIEEVIDNLAYKSWQTEEMLNIVKWIKEYNVSSKVKVEFRGFDMQNGVLAMKCLTDFATKEDAKLLEKLTALKLALRQEQGSISKVLDSLEDHLSSYDSLPGRKRLLRYGSILIQSIKHNNRIGDFKSRDEYMAKNIDWIQKNVGNGKMIISADNDHIRTSAPKMGHYLAQRYSDDYRTFGFTFNIGTYAADGEKSQYEVHPSYSGTYEYLFSKSKFKNFYLDLSATEGVPYLQEMQGFRTIGSRPQETAQFFEMDLFSNFDIMIYLENSEATVSLRERE